MTHVKIKNICIVITMFISTSCFAAPSITGETGVISDGQSLTISGSGFGVKSPAKPLIWATFEDGNLLPSVLGQRTSWDESSIDTINTTNQIPGSNYNVVGEWDSTQELRSFSFRVDKTTWTTIYHFQKRYFDFDATGNQKYWRLWPSSGPNDFLALWHGADTGKGMCYNESEGYVGGDIKGYQGSFPGKNVWLTEEFVWKFSGGSGLNSAGVEDSRGCTGYWDYRVNGVANQHRENVCNGTDNLTRLTTDNFTDSSYLPADGSKVYMDDIYIDDTLARVMLGNASTLAASTHVEPQIPSAWSDTSITTTVNKGSFQNGENMYLFVVDADGNASPGYGPLNFGGYRLRLRIDSQQ